MNIGHSTGARPVCFSPGSRTDYAGPCCVRPKRKYSEGTTAIITMDPGAAMQELGKLGWRKLGREAFVWSKDGLQVRLYHPEKARGLEFVTLSTLLGERTEDARVSAPPRQRLTQLPKSQKR